MTPDELKFMLGQQEGPKLEFKLEYVFDGQGRDRHMDEVAKDILSLANSFGTNPAFLILGAADEVNATTGSRSAQDVRAQSYSLSRFLDIFNNRCTPPLADVTYEEIEYNGSVYGILKIPSSKYKPHHCTRDLVTPNARWPKNTVLVRRGDQVGVATPAEISQLAKEAGIPHPNSNQPNKQNNPLKGVHSTLIRTPLDFKSTIGADAARHSVLFKTSGENEREVRSIISSIFSDLQYIDHNELEMVMPYLDSIEEPLEQLTTLGAELFCVIIPEPYRSGDKTFSMNVANYFFVPQDCLIARADLDKPVVHKFSDHCREALLEFVAHIRSERPIEMFGGLLNVWRKFGMDVQLCSTCCTNELEHSRLLIEDGVTLEKMEEMAEFLKREALAEKPTQ